MPTLSLSSEELAALRHALTAYISDLRSEVAATDSFDMREQLKHEEQVLGRIAAQLEAEGAGG